MDKNFLVRLFGFPAVLIHGDPLVFERWRWLTRKIARTKQKLQFLDVGCGTGAFSIGLSLKGYEGVALSDNERNQMTAAERLRFCRAENVKFEIQDVRELDKRLDLASRFDIVICLECIEHILDDEKLMKSMTNCMSSTGRLFLTSPSVNYKPIGFGDEKNLPDFPVEDGGHVRIGYTEAQLRSLCEKSGLVVEEIGYCCGFFSQKPTGVMRFFSRCHWLIGWSVTLPLRPLVILLEPWLSRVFNCEFYSITLVARKKMETN